MKRTALLVALSAVVLALGACGGDEAMPPAANEPPATRTAGGASEHGEGEPVLAGWDRPAGAELFLADPLTLEPVDGRRAELPFHPGTGTRSPDGAAVAVGAGESGAVALVDLAQMRPRGTLEVESAGYVERLRWVRDDLLLASLAGREAQAAAIDPATLEVLSVHPLGGTVLSSQAAGDELVFLLAPTTGIGPARVAVFDGAELRTATLEGVRAGWAQLDGSDQDYRARQSVPALAVDPAGGRALVVPAGNRVAEVDLRSLDVAYHDLAEPVSLWGRLGDWLEPDADAKAIDGPDRNAVWLPTGLVAVSGAQYVADGDAVDITPAGLVLVDPDGWSVSRLSDEPLWVTFREGALLASAWREGSDAQTLIAFDPDGILRFSLAREGADMSQTAGGRLYVATADGARFEIVDLATGETVAETQPTRETFLPYLD